MPFIFAVSMIAIAVLWLFSVRPYLRKNGKGYTTGANFGVAFWVDWQEAGELAKKKNHTGMIAVCRALLVFQITKTGVIWLTMFASF